jgi:hypothetical protein
MELLRPLADANFAAQTASYTGTAGSTSGWPAGPQGVLIWSSTDAYVRVGEGATATTADTPVPAATPILFHVPQGTGATWRVSAIQVASGGTVYAKPVNKE